MAIDGINGNAVRFDARVYMVDQGLGAPNCESWHQNLAAIGNGAVHYGFKARFNFFLAHVVLIAAIGPFYWQQIM